MNFNNVTMEISAVSKKQYPNKDIFEVALCGRSNVGKSSFINTILNRRNFARTSGTPGKTATINFYNIDNKCRIVDLPGYGYAKVSNAERDKWGKMIDEYLATRGVDCVFQLVDLRHAPSKDDIIMFNWMRSKGYRQIVVMTKLDKVKKSLVQDSIRRVIMDLQLESNAIIVPFSAVTKEGREAVVAILEEGVQS
ncbi:MAG: ribosome biogenesis GTP-binding protein YihA/YsxC [Clostridiales bacterium]|jgi:GTP-binding protein|nr:ribosome biogenesis GTP-binding protein YihA/YsxC [Clostridiales bacterium]